MKSIKHILLKSSYIIAVLFLIVGCQPGVHRQGQRAEMLKWVITGWVQACMEPVESGRKIENGRLELSLDKDQAVSIVPNGYNINELKK